MLELSELNYRCFNGLSLTIGKGLTALLGPNGAGKSTLLGLMAGWHVPEAGRVHLTEMRDCVTPSDMARQRIYLPQQASHTLNNLTVEQIVHLVGIGQPSCLDKADKHLVADVLEWMGLASYRHTSYRALSGGERQRVHIARCRIQAEVYPDVKYAFFDEPLQSLDPFFQRQFLIFWSAWAKERCVVMSLHHLHHVSCADHVVLMHNARIYADGLPKDVLTHARLKEVYQIDFEWINDDADVSYLIEKM